MAVALVHDLAESIAGDITPDDNVSDEDKAKLEDDAMKQIARMLRKATSSEDAAHHLLELFHEYEDRKTNEGKAVKDLDLLDMIIQADEYEERFGVDLSEFFTSTPVTRFVTPELKAAAEQIHKEREERRSKAAKVLSSEPSGIEARDRAFIDEFSKASTLSAEQIKSVVKALREYESYAGSG
jgi:putative hydrolase of HD superfamily